MSTYFKTPGDYNWLTGKMRKAAPPATIRAIPLLALCMVGLAMYFTYSQQWLTGGEALTFFLLGGPGIGFLVYQRVAHRWEQQYLNKKNS